MTPEQKEKQSEHAQRIRTERAIMRMTGMSRSQIRANVLERGLREFQAENQRARVNAAPPPPPRIEVETQEFRPKPLTLGGGEAVGPGANGPVANQDELVVEAVVQIGGTFSAETIIVNGRLA